MYQIDWTIFFNWLISGFVGVFMGAISGWVTYRYQRKLENIKWEREQEQRRRENIAKELTKGLDCSPESIRLLAESMKEMRSGLICSRTMEKFISSRNASHEVMLPNGNTEARLGIIDLLMLYEEIIDVLGNYKEVPAFFDPPFKTKEELLIENQKEYTEITNESLKHSKEITIVKHYLDDYVNSIKKKAG